MKKLASKELAIGASVIVALAILFFGIDYLKGINLFKPANFYVARYDNVAGLEISAPVQIDGYKVGQVREINFDYDKMGKIEVVMAVNKKLQIPEDSRAIIGSSLIGGSYVNIIPGKSKRMIALGGEVPTDAQPDLMATITNDVMPKVSSVIPKIDTLLTNLNALTSNRALITSLNRMDGITQNVLYASDGLNRTLNADVPVILNNANGIISGLGTVTDGLGTFSNNLNKLPIGESMDNVKRTTENLQMISQNLKQFTAQLNNPHSTLGLLMNDPELYNRLTRVSADVDSLLVDIQRNPKRYISIKLF